MVCRKTHTHLQQPQPQPPPTTTFPTTSKTQHYNISHTFTQARTQNTVSQSIWWLQKSLYGSFIAIVVLLVVVILGILLRTVMKHNNLNIPIIIRMLYSHQRFHPRLRPPLQHTKRWNRIMHPPPPPLATTTTIIE